VVRCQNIKKYEVDFNSDKLKIKFPKIKDFIVGDFLLTAFLSLKTNSLYLIEEKNGELLVLKV